MKLIKFIGLIGAAALVLGVGGCSGSLEQLAAKLPQKSAAPTNAEMITGLKEALNSGAAAASGTLSKSGGFSKSDAYKIFLPPEADAIVKNVKYIPGGQKLISDTVERINVSAEQAAQKATPIFAQAISQMSITDAVGILRGGDHAATNYLQTKTSAQLKTAFAPDVAEALNKPIVAGISAENSWNTLTSSYNKAANSVAGKLAKLTPVQTSLDDYVLDKTTDALFSEVAKEEAKIRAQPLTAATDIVKKVFGYAKETLNK